MPEVSVIMNCLNCAKYVAEAIDSVYAQVHDDWEIIFWDNASSDGSAAIAAGYDERLRYFRSAETYSLGKARNLALDHARGALIAFLDCDDIWQARKLEMQIPRFRENQNVGLVYCDSEIFDESGRGRLPYGRQGTP